MDALDDTLQAHFADHVDTVYRALDALYPLMHAAIELICDTLLAERPLLVCGSGSGTALAQVFCTSLLGRAEMERPALPAILIGNDAATLGAIAESYGSVEVLARQVQAIAQPGDVVLLICGSGGNMSAAARAAHARQARVISIGAEGSANAGNLPGAQDVDLRIAAEVSARVTECQLLLLNCISDLVERRLFGAD